MNEEFEKIVQGLGFSEIGAFRRGAFEIIPTWKKRPGVYIWALKAGVYRRPIRVGIACSAGGIGARHTLYNRWLAGKFKPDDEREQKVSALMREKLVEPIDMLAIAVPERAKALALEGSLQMLWGEQLELDLTIQGTWIKKEMNKWRAERAG